VTAVKLRGKVKTILCSIEIEDYQGQEDEKYQHRRGMENVK
jgi:hypothetical protein